MSKNKSLQMQKPIARKPDSISRPPGLGELVIEFVTDFERARSRIAHNLILIDAIISAGIRGKRLKAALGGLGAQAQLEDAYDEYVEYNKLANQFTNQYPISNEELQFETPFKERMAALQALAAGDEKPILSLTPISPEISKIINGAYTGKLTWLRARWREYEHNHPTAQPREIVDTLGAELGDDPQTARGQKFNIVRAVMKPGLSEGQQAGFKHLQKYGKNASQAKFNLFRVSTKTSQNI